MRKAGILIVLLMFCSVCTVIGETPQVHWRIQADSRTNEEAALKVKIADLYVQLTEGVDEKSRPVLIAQSLDWFEFDEDIHASYEADTLVIVQGDGQGSQFSGTFDTFSCGRPVQPRFWLAELLGG